MWQIAKLPSGIGVYWFVIRLSKAAWERTVVLRVVVVFCFFFGGLGRCSAAPSRGTRRAGVGQCERREDQGGRGEAGGAELIDDDDCIGLAGRVERVHRDVIVPRVVLPRK